MSSPSLPAPAHILVVDDEPDLRTLYELTLLREGYRVEAAGSLAEARACLDERSFDAVITDMRLPDGLGLDLLKQLRTRQRPERCVVMTAYGSAENAVEALKAGAFDYLTKPVDLKQFRTVVASAVQGSQQPLVIAAREMTHAVESGLGTPAIGLEALKQRVAKVARGMAPVLVRGESGTGKELVARALHACSQRGHGPLVAVNCGAIPENLLEAEFFGARKGSYTGAQQDREGYFQAASGGTLFLDEIGDLPLAMQSKLLRAIQERSIRPLGSTQEVPVDVRIVSATHKDLAAEVLAGRFRQDLYYRLNVIEVVVPPLRERREDLPLLCQALLDRIARESGLAVPRLSAQAMAPLYALPLAGNVRELENLLHRAVALSEGDELAMDQALWLNGSAQPSETEARVVSATEAQEPAPLPASPAALPPETDDALPPAPTAGCATPALPDPLPFDLQAYLDEQERSILMRALEDNQFNRTATAARLGLSLRQIRYRIERLNIPIPQDSESHEAS